MNAKLLGPGGDQDWCPSTDRLAFDRLDSRGTYQLYTTAPDSSVEAQLTSGSHHVMNPTWHPNGKVLVVQREMAQNPLGWIHAQWNSEWYVNGLWCNLWARTTDSWTQLTDYSNTLTDGAMAPHFSSDGTKLVWSRMVDRSTGTMPFAHYRLMLADWNGLGLQNIRDITPIGAVFIEAHGFSPDGSKVLFTSDIARVANGAWGMDLYTLELESGALANLTHSPYWEEHGSYAPDGHRLAYMSSQPYLWVMFQTELMIRDLGSGQTRQLTHFNVPGSPEYIPGGAMATRSSWSPDGSHLALTVQLSSTYPARQLWMLTL